MRTVAPCVRKDGSIHRCAAKEGKPCPPPSEERAASAPLPLVYGVCRAVSGIGCSIN